MYNPRLDPWKQPIEVTFTESSTGAYIRGLGLTLRVDREWNELQVDYKMNDPRHKPDGESKGHVDLGRTKEDRQEAYREVMALANKMSQHK